MASGTDVTNAIATLRDTMVAMGAHMQAMQTNMVSIEQRFTAHKNIHDPYIAV